MVMTAYYNEIDPFAAQWLRNLIAAGHIADGYVDNRSITDVRPEDLAGFTQCHFFAGIGVWSLALRNAGWSDDRPVWTGSCPCQPFSVAGNQQGMADARHLAPVWLGLIKACKPPILFGEQVSDAIKKHWLDSLFDELEGEGYACGASVLPACSVGAPHIRQRLTFGAYRLADTDHAGPQRGLSGRTDTQRETEHGHAGRSRAVSGLADADCQQQRPNGISGSGAEHVQGRREQSPATVTGLCGNSGASPDNSFWSGADWLGCRDGKFRPVESSTFPLVNGATQRVGRLRAYGNAIVPQAATEFIIAFEGAIYDANN